MKIYTKTGDKGLTSLFDGTRVKKFNIRIETYGTIDELNSVIGVVIAELKIVNSKKQKEIVKIQNELVKIQNDLLDIGSYLANPSIPKDAPLSKKLSKHTAQFEKFIDAMTSKMPVLNNFILPGGGKVGSLLHVCRTVVRRAERRIVELAHDNEIEKDIIVFVNRLSDLFFTMSRYANFLEKEKDTIWTKQSS